MNLPLTFIFTSALFLCAHSLFAQSYECGYDDTVTRELASTTTENDFDCDLTDQDFKCVRIKFHYLNNTLEPSLAPDDAFYADLLQKINEALAPGKIRFTFDYNCIHRENLTPSVISQITEHSDVSTLIDSGEPQMEFDENSINVYSLQKTIPTVIEGIDVYIFLASPFSHAVVPLDIFGWIMHELGHTLGLGHTFSGSQGFSPTAPPLDMVLNGLCKDPHAQNSGQVLCKTRGDKICDTGIDPWTLDIGPPGIADGKRDKDKWVDYETCTQLPDLLNSYADGCFDTIRAWEIPVTNFMSYYRPCRKKFTPCQFEWCHMELTGQPQLLACNTDPYFCPEPDITINGVVKWENQTKQLCPGQKIIIAKGAFLTIDNSTVTINPQILSNTCPGLSDLWDGIYIEGEKHKLYGYEYYSNFGRLVIKNNSIIEYSKNGIQAITGFKSVDIIRSTFQNNLTQLNLSFTKPFYDVSFGTANLDNSDFIVGPPELSFSPVAQTQMNFVAANVNMNNCLLENPYFNTEADIMGIQSTKGKLTIVNGSKIVNFHIAVDKVGDSRYLSAKGLHVENSSILNADYAIRNTSKELFVKNNWLEGDIVSAGICNSHWLSNYIKAHYIAIQSPVQSTRFEENLFENAEVQFYGPNEYSYLLCNTWKNTGSRDTVPSAIAAIAFDQATLPESWGDLNTSSGNRHLDPVKPLLIAQDNLTNYFFEGSADQHFTYDSISSLLVGRKSLADRGCAYNYPIIQPVYDPDFVISQMNFPDEINNKSIVNIPTPPETRPTLRNIHNQLPKEENVIHKNRFIIYQNISSQCFTIESINNYESEILFRVFDLQGILLKSLTTTLRSMICLEDYSSGIYIITIYDSSLARPESHKLVLINE